MPLQFSVDSSEIYSEMQKDYQNMLRDKRYCDVTIKCDDGKISAHRNVLAARSPVFSAMFDHNMLERSTGTIDIPNFEFKIFELFLEFLYAEKFDDKMETETVLDLFIVSDKYQVPSLTNKCSSLLMSALSVKNVCEVIATADKVSHGILKASAMDYMLENISSILCLSEWSQWIDGNVTLSTEILLKLAVKFPATPVKNVKGSSFPNGIHETNHPRLTMANDELSTSSSSSFLLDSKLFRSSDIYSEMQNDYKKMLADKKYCDVIIKCDNREISAHRNVLAVRSPVFSDMFDQDMLEERTSTVNIYDVDFKTLELFLDFIYAGEFDDKLENETILNLFVASDKYQVLSMRKKCSSLLMTTLSPKNFCEVIAAANKVGHYVLKQAAINYVLENTSSVLSSSEWSQWIEKEVTLSTEILRNVAAHFQAKLISEKKVQEKIEAKEHRFRFGVSQPQINSNSSSTLTFGTPSPSSNLPFGSSTPSPSSAFTFGSSATSPSSTLEFQLIPTPTPTLKLPDLSKVYESSIRRINSSI